MSDVSREAEEKVREWRRKMLQVAEHHAPGKIYDELEANYYEIDSLLALVEQQEKALEAVTEFVEPMPRVRQRF